MSKIHEFECNSCSIRQAAKYDGANFIHPEGWIVGYDDRKGVMTDFHLCSECVQKIKFKGEDVKGNPNDLPRGKTKR